MKGSMRRAIPHVTKYPHSATSPWVIQGIQENGKRKRLFFPTKDAAEAELARIKAKLNHEGRDALLLSDSVRAMAREGTEKLKPYDKTLRDAVEFYLAYLRESPDKSITFSALVTEFLGEQARLARSELHQKDLSCRLARFCDGFGNRLVRSITAPEITAWLAALVLSAQSVNNYHSRVQNLFSFAVKHGYLDHNPASVIERIKCVDEPPEIFTPDELRRLLDIAAPELLPCLAIGAFAGLRTAEILRLEWKNIDLARGHLNVPATVAKTARRRLITMSPNLLAWLSPYSAFSGRIWQGAVREYHSACQAGTKAAALDHWPNNGLRHSFASYYLGKHQDAPRLALDMGHTSTNLIFNTYREVVTPDAAEAYWRIFPHAPAENVVPMVA
jgi:integrase